jgi:hypothetical protein
VAFDTAKMLQAYRENGDLSLESSIRCLKLMDLHEEPPKYECPAMKTVGTHRGNPCGYCGEEQ